MTSRRPPTFSTAFLLLSLLTALEPSTLHAAVQLGDLALATDVLNDVNHGGQVRVFRDGSPSQDIASYTLPITGAALDTNRNVYVLRGGGYELYGPDGNFLGSDSFTAGDPSSLVFDAIGNAYVSVVGGPDQILKLDSSGNVTRRYGIVSAGFTPLAIDLASDQCTLFMVGFNSTIKRFDVCQTRLLSDIPTLLPGSTQKALRLLPDGTLLVTNRDAIYRLSASGQIIMRFDVADQDWWTGIAVDASGLTFWAGAGLGNAVLFQFDLSTGVAVRGPFPAGDTVLSLAIVGEPRAALAPSEIPALGPSVLILLVGALCVVAIRSL